MLSFIALLHINSRIHIKNNFKGNEYNIDSINDNKENMESNKTEYQENTLENPKPIWTIEIPEIGLAATIEEGTSKDIMDKYVGHFEETNTEYGNIGLAAHNRGYKVNYFQNLKKLKIGSEVIYRHNNFKMTYSIKTIKIIENTNWDFLQETDDNRITLITCVENKPQYRRCLQGVKKEEREEV